MSSPIPNNRRYCQFESKEAMITCSVSVFKVAEKKES